MWNLLLGGSWRETVVSLWLTAAAARLSTPGVDADLGGGWFLLRLAVVVLLYTSNDSWFPHDLSVKEKRETNRTVIITLFWNIMPSRCYYTNYDYNNYWCLRYYKILLRSMVFKSILYIIGQVGIVDIELLFSHCGRVRNSLSLYFFLIHTSIYFRFNPVFS